MEIIKNVKDIYNNIANDFDNTRYSRWKGVKKFLDNIKPNSILCDLGCGNGKYLEYRKDIFTIGVDISNELLNIINQKQTNPNLIYFDISKKLCFKNNSFDNIISIAVIHHLPTYQLRSNLLKELSRITRKNGKIYITLWSEESIKKEWTYLQNNDYLVPWKNKNQTYQRFYHIFSKKECLQLINDIPELILEDITFEKENWQLTIINNKNII
jgi:ubiquinone/menaquinone biosynthesis C-methylase UbiE